MVCGKGGFAMRREIRRLSGRGLCVLVLVLAWSAGASGDGVIIVEPPEMPRPVPVRPTTQLEMVEQKVEVRIRDLTAVTEVEQVFRNRLRRQVEGTYLFPLPADAAVSDFTLKVGGKVVHGELLDADKARAIYRRIVLKLRDPALLEFVGQRLYRAKIFPIPAGGRVKVSLTFTSQLQAMSGIVSYRYPLRPDRMLGTIGRFEFSARIRTTKRLAGVFSPTHDVDVARLSAHQARAKYTAEDLVPERDLILCYQLAEQQFGLAMLTHRTGDEDGYFMLWISPVRPSSSEGMPKDICFVIDKSGSMGESGGKKIEQAKAALEFCLNNLDRRDRFNVVAFSTEVRTFADKLVPAEPQRLRAALRFVRSLKAMGGTDINGALLAALKMRPKGSDRPYMIVFLTDGLPTVGVTNYRRILENVRKANSSGARMFVFGVGYNVNTVLLDSLAEQNKGTRVYVEPREDLEVKLSNFYKQISEPILSDLTLRIKSVSGDLRVYDVYPKRLPDLFAGTDLVVVGRYRASGRARIMLAGREGRQRVEYAYTRKFPRRMEQNEYLPQIWASRKIGYLLDQIRLHGETEEIKREIVDLARRYGIVTPYTSFLIVEDERVARATAGASVAVRRMAEAQKVQADRARVGARAAAAPGAAQVDVSKSAMELRAARDAGVVGRQYARAMRVGPRPGQPSVRAARMPVQFVAGRAFYKQNGRWVDSLYDGKVKPKKIKLFSDEYFELLRRRPDLRRIVSVARRVVFVDKGTVYEIVE